MSNSNKLSVQTIIALARRNLLFAGHINRGMAVHACADAVRAYDQGKVDEARNRALDSLGYSVGIGHEDFKAAIG